MVATTKGISVLLANCKTLRKSAKNGIRERIRKSDGTQTGPQGVTPADAGLSAKATAQVEVQNH